MKTIIYKSEKQAKEYRLIENNETVYKVKTDDIYCVLDTWRNAGRNVKFELL